MSYLDDPRVFLATERTLLAWIRTEIAILALAFLIKKFGLEAGHTPDEGQAVGFAVQASVMALCAATVLLSILSAVQAKITLSKLGDAEVPGPLAPKLVLVGALLSILLCVGMSAVLVLV